MLVHLPELIDSGVQVIWQTGKNYYADCKAALDQLPHPNIICTDFVSQMPLAYALADLVISRAGASSISELCLLGKASILVPSPNVAEDHQTKNAMALVEKGAAEMVRDAEAVTKGMERALELLADKEHLQQLSKNIMKLGISDAAERVVRQIEKEW